MRRTAVILDAHPLWLDAVEGVLERLDLDVVGKTSSFAERRDLVSGRGRMSCCWNRSTTRAGNLACNC